MEEKRTMELEKNSFLLLRRTTKKQIQEKNNVSYNTWRNMKTVVKYAQTDPRK